MRPAVTSQIPILLISVVYASVIIGAALLFRGSPNKVWIDSTIAVVGIAVWLWFAERLKSRCC